MTAVYSGSFDPVTFGHIDIIRRAAAVFERLYVVIAVNPDKSPMFSTAERLEMLKSVLTDFANVQVDSWNGLTVDYAREKGANVLVRGIRKADELEYELNMADYNRSHFSGCEVVFFPADKRYSELSSSLVKKLAGENRAISCYVPAAVEDALIKRARKVSC